MRYFFFYICLILFSELHAQCGSGIQILNSSGINVIPTSANVSPCGAVDCAEICPNGLTTYSLSIAGVGGGASYNWSFGSGVTILSGNSNSSSLLISVSNSTTVRAVVNNGCTDTFDIELINTLPIPNIVVSNQRGGNASSSLSACQGDSLKLYSTSNPIYSYLWSNGATTDSLSILVAGSGTISLDVTDSQGCISRNSVSLTSRRKPNLTSLIVQNDTLCYGERIQVRDSISNAAVITSGGGLITINWSLFGSSGSLENLSTSLSSWQPNLVNQSGAFFISVYAVSDYGNGNFCTSAIDTSAQIVVLNEINSRILVNGSPNNQTGPNAICMNSSFTLASSLNQFYGRQMSLLWNQNGSSPLQTNTFYNPLSLGNTDTLYFIQNNIPRTYLYAVTFTDNLTGCSQTDEIEVEVKPIPELSFSPPNPRSICQGDTITISINPPPNGLVVNSYNWSEVIAITQPTTISYNSNNSAITVANLTTNLYFNVQAAATNGCVNSVIDTILVTNQPTVQINLSQVGPVCSGTPINIGINPSSLGSGNLAYQWIIGDSIFLADSIPSGLFVSGTNPNGTFRYLPYNLSNQLDTFPISVIVRNQTGGSCLGRTNSPTGLIVRPQVVVQIPSVPSLCKGDSINLNAQVISGTSGSTYNYLWFLPTSISGPATQRNFKGLLDINASSPTQVIVRATDQNFCSGSDTISIQSSICNTTPRLRLSNERFCIGDTVFFNVRGHSFISCSTLLGGPCPVATPGTCSDNTTNFSYYRTLLNKTRLYSLDFNGTIFTSNDTFFNVKIASNMPDTVYYTLYLGYQEEIHKDVDLTAGLTDCQIIYENVFDNILSGYIIINKPQIAVRDSITTCLNQNIQLEASCTGCVGSAQYNWGIGANQITSVRSTNNLNQFETVVNQNVLGSGVYTVTVSDAYNCTATEATAVNLQSSPGLYVTEVGGTDSVTVANFCPTSSVALRATTTNACSNCNYIWSTGQASQSITINQTGFYSVTVQQNDCIENTTVSVQPFAQPSPSIIGSNGNSISNFNICGGIDTIQIDPSSCVNCSYLWNTGATTPYLYVNTAGGYFVRAIDTNGCIGYSNPILVNNSIVGQNSVATANPSQICNGGQSTLSVSACVGCSYRWVHINTGTITAGRQIQVSQPGNYYAIIRNSDSCEYSSNIVPITQQSVSAPQIFSNTTVLCSSTQQAELSFQNTTGMVAYQWYRNGQVISSATSSILNTVQTGNYYCRVTFLNGCVNNSDSIQINSGTFAPSLSASNTVVCSGQTVTLATQTGAGFSYQWYKDGVLQTGLSTSSIYNASLPGDYYVRVTDNNGCVSLTNIINLTVSSINTVNALTSAATICPGETATLSVTLCPGCLYQWYDAITGNPIQSTSTTSNFNYQTTGSGLFYARVSNGFCTTNSDTVQVSLLPVITPPINSTSTFVCDGVAPQVFTQSCAGCNYTWLLDSVQIFGALNDPFYNITDTSAYGAYQVVVTYQNGCSDTSASLQIANGSYDLFIKADSTNPQSVIVCNGSNVQLSIDSIQTTSLNCSLGCTFSWIRNNIPVTPSNTPNFTLNTGAAYYLLMTDSRGCREQSNTLIIREEILQPVLSANPTLLCGSQPVTLRVSTCPSCSYEWYQGVTPLFLNPLDTSYVTSAVGVYFVDVTNNNCVARTPLVSVNNVPTVPLPINSTNLNICNADTVSLFMSAANCSSCTYQWLLNGSPITAATTPVYVTNTPGNYQLERTFLGSNCKDSSAVLLLDTISPPLGFGLDLTAVNYSVLASTLGSQVNLYNAVLPAYLGATSSGVFYSQPFNAALSQNSGMSPAPSYHIFHSDTSGSGFHRIFYRFDTLGCSFIDDDILLVLDDPNITITTQNLNAPQYEACVSDTITLTVSGLGFLIDSVYLFDLNNNYRAVALSSTNLIPSTLGTTTVWNGTIRFVVPDWSIGSFVRVTSLLSDTFFTPFLLIHNTNLDISGLPSFVCSNGTPVNLTGTPSGGYFTAQYSFGSKLPVGTSILNAFASQTFLPTAMPLSSYDTNMVQTVRVFYNYVNRFTNGIACPQVDTISRFVTARAVFLDSVKYNPISISQDRELLSNLVYRVYPYQSQPSWIRRNTNSNIGFSGNFTFPAGNPIDFLPSNAGVGKHAMSYIVQNGSCFNQITDSITVIPAPNSIGIPDSICRNQTFSSFGRSLPLFSYFDGPNTGVFPSYILSDTIHQIRFSGLGLVQTSSTLNLEQFTYDPLLVPGANDLLSIEYWYKKIERRNGIPIDTIEYVVGSVKIPVFIDTVQSVDIIDSVVLNSYCEINQFYLLSGSPSGGYFTLQGGTGSYAVTDTLNNSIINPYLVHQNENSTTNYTISYIRPGLVCLNSDSKTITIPEPIDPSFGTQSGRTAFCRTDPIDPILTNAVGNFTNTLLINGVTQPGIYVNPIALNLGNQVLTHVVNDTAFNCLYTAIDTYLIHPLPAPRLIQPDTFLSFYCTNGLEDTIRVSPRPLCDLILPGGLTILTEGFDSLAFPWIVESQGPGNSWVRSGILPYAGLGTAFVNTSNDNDNTWMFTPNLNLTTGQTYQIQLVAAAGNCNPPPCLPASFRIKVAAGASIAAQTQPQAQLIVDTSISHTFYQPYTFTYTHTGLSGNYNFGFQCYSGIDARSLTFDDLKIINTSINGCVQGGVGTLVGPGISFISDSTYTIDPRVVAPGTYNYRYVYRDAQTGCSDSSQHIVQMRAHPLPSFNNLDSSYCDNAASTPLIGNPSGGVFSGINVVGAFPTYFYDPNQGVNQGVVTYTYTDPATTCVSSVRDTVTVTSIADSAKIINILPSGYCVNIDSVLLDVSTVLGAPFPGKFYGPGVRKGLLGPQIATFFPDSAVIDAGRYGNMTLTYIYLTNSGCVDTTRITTRIHAMPELSFTNLPDSVCSNADTIILRVSNLARLGPNGTPTQIILPPFGPAFGGGTYLPALPFNDLLIPSNYSIGRHYLSFTYIDSFLCTSTILDSFKIDSIPVIQFAGLGDRIFCENDPPVTLLAYPPYYPNDTIRMFISSVNNYNDTLRSSFFILDPAQLVDLNIPNRRYDVTYVYEDLNKCSNSGVDSFFIRPYPRITMSGIDSTYCTAADTIPLNTVSPLGGFFVDNIVPTGIYDSTNLNLIIAGPRVVTYFFTDTMGCSNRDSLRISVYHSPDVQYQVLGACQNQQVFFKDTLSNIDNNDSITQVEWIFGDGQSVITLVDSIVDTSHVYASPGVYQTGLAITNFGICTDTNWVQWVVSPSIVSYPYVEDFQSTAGQWYQEQEMIVPDSQAIWKRVEMNRTLMNDPGNFAWTTRPDSFYTYDDRAWVYSPCFDFSQAQRPMIVMNIWRDMLKDIDGAVLEHYDEYTYQWKRIGEKDKGISWYQTDFLVSRPGNQDAALYPQGWTGQSNHWEKARYKLDFLAGRRQVRFRIAFASDENTVMEGHEGFAFDSVWVGERSRNVLLEHFSNYYHVNNSGLIMDQIDQYVYDSLFNRTNGRDVSLIQYQTDISSIDPINAQYATDFDARVLYYGINANSQFRVDGMLVGSGKSEDLSQNDLDFDMLQFPAFDLQIAPLVFSGNTIQMNLTATANTGLDSSDYSITVAITEDSVRNGRNFPMIALLRKLNPDATGFTFQQSWQQGQSVSLNPSWVYDFGTINPSRIQAIAYIQDNRTKEILQVATTRNLGIYPPVGVIQVDSAQYLRADLELMSLYPNPTLQYFNVTFEEPVHADYQWKIVDLLGRTLESGQIFSGEQALQISTEDLPPATYFFVIYNQNAYVQRQVVKLK